MVMGRLLCLGCMDEKMIMNCRFHPTPTVLDFNLKGLKKNSLRKWAVSVLSSGIAAF